jgi:hypothetical protein
MPLSAKQIRQLFMLANSASSRKFHLVAAGMHAGRRTGPPLGNKGCCGVKGLVTGRTIRLQPASSCRKAILGNDAMRNAFSSPGNPWRAAGGLMAFLLPVFLAACVGLPGAAGPDSDAPEIQSRRVEPFNAPASYFDALRTWRTPEEVSAWIGARFQYDPARAVELSETRRNVPGRPAVYAPQEFFAAPSGVCVDLARFAVETLRHIDPASHPSYLMIEFAPVQIGGDTLRRHWLASFRRDGRHYFFADSKRPGHIAGPHTSPQEFIEAYAQYRGRPIVAFRELDSFQRRQRPLTSMPNHEERP